MLSFDEFDRVAFHFAYGFNSFLPVPYTTQWLRHPSSRVIKVVGAVRVSGSNFHGVVGFERCWTDDCA
jgi:hypothetical protein